MFLRIFRVRFWSPIWSGGKNVCPLSTLVIKAPTFENIFYFDRLGSQFYMLKSNCNCFCTTDLCHGCLMLHLDRVPELGHVWVLDVMHRLQEHVQPGNKNILSINLVLFYVQTQMFIFSLVLFWPIFYSNLL